MLRNVSQISLRYMELFYFSIIIHNFFDQAHSLSLLEKIIILQGTAILCGGNVFLFILGTISLCFKVFNTCFKCYQRNINNCDKRTNVCYY